MTKKKMNKVAETEARLYCLCGVEGPARDFCDICRNEYKYTKEQIVSRDLEALTKAMRFTQKSLVVCAPPKQKNLIPKLSNKTLYLMLNFAQDFIEAKKILNTFFIQWSDKTYTAKDDDFPLIDGYEQFRVLVNPKQKQLYILHDEVEPKEIKAWIEGGEVAIIDYKEDLAYRMARELFVAVNDYGCGDHFQDALSGNMIQIWDTTGDSFGHEASGYLYQGFDTRKHRHFDGLDHNEGD